MVTHFPEEQDQPLHMFSSYKDARKCLNMYVPWKKRITDYYWVLPSTFDCVNEYYRVFTEYYWLLLDSSYEISIKISDMNSNTS